MSDLRSLRFGAWLVCGCITWSPLWSQTVPQSPLPAPPLSWGDWQGLPEECGGVKIWVALSKDDGRNDFEVKLKFQNNDSHRVHARLEAVLLSDRQETAVRKQPNAVMNPGTSAEGGASAPSLALGRVFPSAVNDVAPHQIRRISLSNIEVAQIDVFPKGGAAPAYYRDFGDHPTTKCGPWVLDVNSNVPRYVALTRDCSSHLPQWTRSCDDAVQEIVVAYNAAPEEHKTCILKWRAYQKCYEIYAFNSNPSPRPNCSPPPCLTGSH